MAVGGLAWLLAPRAWSDAFATSAGTLTDALRAVPATAALLALQPIVAVVFASLTGLERFAFLNGARLLHGVLRVALGVAVALRGGGLVGVLAAQAVADAVMVTVVLVAARRAPVTREPGPPLRSAVKAPARARRSLEPGRHRGRPAGRRRQAGAGHAALRGRGRLLHRARGRRGTSGLVRRHGLGLPGAAPGRLRRGRRRCRSGAPGRSRHASRAVRDRRGGRASVGRGARAALAVAGSRVRVAVDPGARVLLVGLLANVSVYGPHAAIRARAPALTLAVLYGLELPVFALALWLLVRPWGVAGAAAAWALRASLDAAAQHVIARRTLGRPIVPLALPALATLALGAFALACHLAGPAALLPRAAGGLAFSVAALLLLPAEDRHSLRRALWLAETRGAA